MIHYINIQLSLWGQWSRGGHTRLGYPGKAAFVMQGGGGSPPILADDLAMDLDRSVRGLPPDLRRTVELFYLKMRDFPVESIAKELHVCRDTVYARLHKAHVRVMEDMQDQAVEEATWSAQIETRKWRV